MSFGELQAYINYLTTLNYSENTIKTYKLAVLQYHNYLSRIDRTLDSVIDEDIYNLIDILKESYKYSTVNLKLSAIKHYYKYLKLSFPADVFVRNDRPTLYPLSDRELKLFNRWLDFKDDSVKIPLKIMLNTGMRVGELSKLLIDDFLLIKGKSYVRVDNTKNYSSRIIPLNLDLYNQVLEYYHDRVYFGTVFDFTKRNYQYHMAQFCKEYNVKASLHTLRRTYATYLQSIGYPVELVQLLLGHKNITTTMIYIKITDEQIQKMEPVSI